MSIVVAEGAVVGRRGSKGHLRAQVVFANLAHFTTTARHARLKSNTVAHLEISDALAKRSDNTSRFVAQHHGAVAYEMANSAVCPVMDIRATDTRRFDVDNDLAGTSNRHRSVLLSSDDKL